MPLPTGNVIGLMMDNLKKRKTVFPISQKRSIEWAKNLDIPEGGEKIIYTGSMYQLLPYMIAAVRNMGLIEDSFLGKFVGVGRFFNRMFNVSAFISIPSRANVKSYRQIIRNIAILLKQAGVEFGYLYKKELYAGTLAYDLGADDTFRMQAQRVYNLLKENGVRSVITIDPHTTNMLRSVYPTVIDGYDIEVKSYLEVLAASNGLQPLHSIEKEITVHDSCVYARYEDVIEEPRQLLRRAGYTVKEPEDNGKLTHCCGGPIESLFPKISHKIGEKRVRQLKNANGQGVATMCPICMATLKEASNKELEIDDISSFLMKAFCEVEEKP
ncbi:MAG: (Fe-S)-binding protein [candidate division Zixibacteria bacterium]|nr:(Fe-S)-binding protein [candidate division Zixibacteria bacterium]